MNNTNDHNAPDKLTRALFITYLAILLWILVFKLGVRFSYMDNRVVNLVPFREFLYNRIDLPQLILNILIFVPLGVYAGILFRSWESAKRILFFLLLSLLIEAIQFLFRIGAFDSTDIITNTLGGITGSMIFSLIVKASKDERKAQKIVNAFGVTGTILMILLLVLLKLNMLPVRYQ